MIYLLYLCIYFNTCGYVQKKREREKIIVSETLEALLDMYS